MTTKIGLVDDNEIMRAHIRQLFDGDHRIEIIFEASDGVGAVRQIRDKQPDIVLLDMVMPRMDGMEVLQTIRKDASLRKRPAIIVVSAIGQERIVEQAFSLGVSYYIMKPFEDRMLVRRVRQVMNGQSMPPAHGMMAPRISYAVDGAVDSDVAAVHILHDLGVPPHIKGYQYLRDAIIMVIDAPDIINSVTKTLYPTIARMNSTTASRVERAIRHAIEITWQRGNKDLLDEMFGYTIRAGSGKPTNSEFIALVSEKIRIAQKKGA